MQSDIKQSAPATDMGMVFPCRFPIKAIGVAQGDFKTLVFNILKKHSPALSAEAVRSRPGRTGKYVSVTVTITAGSRRQLDNIYFELTAHEKVLIAL